jgi:hypothetical protein
MKPGRRIHSSEEIAYAIRRGKGLKSKIAKLLGMSVRGLELRLQKCPEPQDVMCDVREMQLDLAESKLMQAIANGEGWAICLFLKTQGKHRGWSERSIVDAPQEYSLAKTIEQWDRLMNAEPASSIKS